jgi:ABC-type transport system involved in cytochrome bd biosynthesis fused ATPase/permease subunit
LKSCYSGNSQLLKQKVIELSVVQQQRVAVARALYASPALIIADEPTLALGTQSRELFIRLLLDCAQTSTVVFVSHDMSLALLLEQHFGLYISRSVNLFSTARFLVIAAGAAVLLSFIPAIFTYKKSLLSGLKQ